MHDLTRGATTGDAAEERASGSASETARRLYAGFEPDRIVYRKHPWRVVAAVLVGLLVVRIAWTAFTSEGFDWPTVQEYFFDEVILRGVWTTIYLTVLAMTIGITTGVLAAVMRQSPNPLLANVARVYIWAFRGVPTLVQLLLWFNLAALFPQVTFAIPFGPTIWEGNPNSFMTPLLAAMLGLGLCEGAYSAEIVRGGILSVDRGQREAAAALGMTESQTFSRIVFPQAMRTIIPPIGNQVIGMLKFTSLASVIGVLELTYAASTVYQLNFKVIPLLIVASIWYLILATILQLGQNRLETRFGRGVDTRRIGQRGKTKQGLRDRVRIKGGSR